MDIEITNLSNTACDLVENENEKSFIESKSFSQEYEIQSHRQLVYSKPKNLLKQFKEKERLETNNPGNSLNSNLMVKSNESSSHFHESISKAKLSNNLQKVKEDSTKPTSTSSELKLKEKDDDFEVSSKKKNSEREKSKSRSDAKKFENCRFIFSKVNTDKSEKSRDTDVSCLSQFNEKQRTIKISNVFFNDSSFQKSAKDESKKQRNKLIVFDSQNKIMDENTIRKNKKLANYLKNNPEQIEYEVERIIDKKYENKQVKYLVKWEGYDSTQNTWEPISSFENNMNLIHEYESNLNKQKIDESNIKIRKIGNKVGTKTQEVVKNEEKKSNELKSKESTESTESRESRESKEKVINNKLVNYNKGIPRKIIKIVSAGFLKSILIKKGAELKNNINEKRLYEKNKELYEENLETPFNSKSTAEYIIEETQKINKNFLALNTKGEFVNFYINSEEDIKSMLTEKEVFIYVEWEKFEGETEIKNYVSTKYFKMIDPGMLVDFYENNISFT